MGTKESVYSLAQIIKGIELRRVPEGTLFVNTLGEHAVVEKGGLQWYQSKNYVGTPVTVTAETISDYWKMAELQQEAVRTFTEVLPLIAEGRTVTLVTAQGVNYTVNSLQDLQRLVTYDTNLEELYKATAITYRTVTVAPKGPTPPTPMPVPTRGVTERKGGRNGAKDLKQRKGRKLRPDEVETIRTHFANGVHSLELAEAYGVSQRMIHYIVKKQYWSATK